MALSSPTGRMLVARGLYRRWLSRYFSTVTLAGLAPDDEPILLRRIFVHPVLTPEKISDHAPEELIHHQSKPLSSWLTPQKEAQILLISGEAGSGKTTLVSAMVDSLAGEVRDPINQQLEGYVPFPILLREAPLRELGSLNDLIDWWLQQAKKEVPDLEVASVRSFLDMGKGLVLLDGLDEVGTLEDRARTMRWLHGHRWVAGRKASLAREIFLGEGVTPNIVLVTARPSGFEGLREEDLPPSGRSLFVAPFSHEQIRAYLTRWFELRPLRSQQRQGTVATLFNRLTSSQQAGRLLPLARRPAYLASLAFVHGTRGELPYTRAALYEQLVEAYIEMLDRQRGLLDRAEQAGELPVWDRLEKIEVLAAVAFQAHVGATAKQKEKQAWERTEEDRRIVWSREELEAAVRLAVEGGAERFRTIRPEHVTLLTDYFVSRTGLLVETREGRYQFGHLSFQEYLTALFVLNRAAAGSDKAAGLESILFRRLGEPGWMEVGVLALAIDATRSGGKGHEPVLARLDLNRPEQLAFLTQILSGEEIRLTAEERRAWIFVWLGFWVAREDQSDLHSVLRFPANQEGLKETWKIVCTELGQGKSVFSALNSLVSQAVDLAQEAPPAQKSLDLLVETFAAIASPQEPPAPYKAWRRFPSSAKEDLAAGRLLVVPLLGDFEPKGWEETLVPVINSAELFIPGCSSGRLDPTAVQLALDSWCIRSERSFKILMERSPLLWWLQDEYFLTRIDFLLDQASLSPLACWRLALTRRVFRSELAWWLGLIFSGTSPKARDLDLARDLDRDLAQARDRARDRDRDRDAARTPHLDLNQALDRLARHPSFQKTVAQLYSATSQAILLDLFVQESPRPIQRSSVEKDLALLPNTEAAAAPLAGTPFHRQAIEEWQQVLASPLSPIPLLRDALSSEWKELPTDPKKIIALFNKAVDELERKAAKGEPAS